MQYSLAVTIFVLPSFSLSLSCEGTAESRVGRLPKEAGLPMQLKLLQAKQEETAGSDRRRKGGKEKVRETFQLPFLPLPVSLLCVCLCFFSYPLLKPYCICPPSLAGGNCSAGGPDGRGGGGGERDFGFREFS